MALNITMATDYAIRAMIQLASLPSGGSALRTEISDRQAVPSYFMAKVLRRLVDAGLLRSTRGVRGGFSLSRPATEITMLDVVEAIEGPIALTRCATDPPDCPVACGCPASLVWSRVQDQMRTTLRGATLECLVGAHRRNGRVERLPDRNDYEEVLIEGVAN